jgi:glycosyltransferase involved in cell wall biosynthesis
MAVSAAASYAGARVASERIRLLKFVTLFALGGTERQVTTLANGLDGSRFDLSLACLRREGDLMAQMERLPSSPPIEYGVTNLYNARAFRERLRFAQDLRARGIQIVHTYNFYPNVFAIPAARLARAPVIVASIRDMGVYLTPLQIHVQRIVCRLADRVVVNADAVRGWLADQGYDARKVEVIKNGVDLTRFTRARGRSALRQELGLPAHSPLVAVISRISPSKGLEYFLQAATIVAAERPDVRFLIVGEAEPRDQEYRKGLVAYAQRLGLARRAIFTGLRHDVPEVLSEVALSVLPSLSEGLSNVLLESMATGIPVVATRVGGNPEAVEDGLTGILVPPRDTGALATVMQRILGDRELAARFGTAGRQRVAERFSIDVVIRQTQRLYERLLEEKGHAV